MLIVSILVTASVVGYLASLGKERFPIFVYILTAFIGSAIGAGLSFGDSAFFLKYPIFNIWTVPAIFSVLFALATLFVDRGAIKKAITTILIIILSIAGLFYMDSFPSNPNGVEEDLTLSVTDFETCIEAGNFAMESYPRQCRHDERTFVEDIGNELEKTDLIRIDSPRPNAVIESPLTIEGEARGYWFFEGTFSMELLDADSSPIGRAIVFTQKEWMTENFVQFGAELEFLAPENKGKGTLILRRANPSGLPENEDSLQVPVLFE